jgi:hypothetical protein
VSNHGIDGGFYDNITHLAKGGIVGEPHRGPRLLCLCGYVTSPSADNWEEAGNDLDEHLEEVGQ